jgi:hypothetical protein
MHLQSPAVLGNIDACEVRWQELVVAGLGRTWHVLAANGRPCDGRCLRMVWLVPAHPSLLVGRLLDHGAVDQASTLSWLPVVMQPR